MQRQHAKQHGTLVRKIWRGKDKKGRGELEVEERKGGSSHDSEARIPSSLALTPQIHRNRQSDGDEPGEGSSLSKRQEGYEKGGRASESPERTAVYNSLTAGMQGEQEQSEVEGASRCASPELGGFVGAARSTSPDIRGSDDAQEMSPDLLWSSRMGGSGGGSSSSGPTVKACPECDIMVSTARDSCEACGYNFRTGKPHMSETGVLKESAPRGEGSNEEGSVIADSCADTQSNFESGSPVLGLSGSR